MAETALVVVIDALGVETLRKHIGSARDSHPHLPNLSRMGLGNLLGKGYNDICEPTTKHDIALEAAPSSVWSDSVMGHRELMGFIDPNDYRLFMEGFPAAFVNELEDRIGRPILFNKRAGGMEAIEINNSEHLRNGGVILYASMCDPIAQFAADEKEISPQDLEEIARTAFTLSQEHGVRLTRVITRPYESKEGRLTRTSNRRDVVLGMPPDVETFIDIARRNGVYTVSIGKSADVVNTVWDCDRNLRGPLPTDLKSMYTMKRTDDKNPYSVREALGVLKDAKKSGKPTFVLCNLPDTDSLYGHTRNSAGALESLQAFDRVIPLLEAAMPEDGTLVITADQGMRDGGDYGYHSREAVPVLARRIGTRLSDSCGQTGASTYAIVGLMCATVFGFGDEFKEKCSLRDRL